MPAGTSTRRFHFCGWMLLVEVFCQYVLCQPENHVFTNDTAYEPYADGSGDRIAVAVRATRQARAQSCSGLGSGLGRVHATPGPVPALRRVHTMLGVGSADASLLCGFGGLQAAGRLTFVREVGFGVVILCVPDIVRPDHGSNHV